MLQPISGCDTWSFKEVSLDTHLSIHSVGFIWSLYASVAKKSYFCSRLACILQTSSVSNIDLVSFRHYPNFTFNFLG